MSSADFFIIIIIIFFFLSRELSVDQYVWILIQVPK